ncbi:MAG: carboxypeptidase regulatory-like domain-containing protein [Myxococcales bacterium]|nr:carboxypeptidase regulatory-like domain-containing protein [Myxococcales bacterium]
MVSNRWSGKLALFGALTAAACSSDSSGDGGTTQTASQTAVFGVVTSVGGQPVAGATVQIGSATATTDAQGRYAASASPGSVLVRVAADGFVAGVRSADVVQGSGSALDFRLLERADPVAVDAAAGGTVAGARGAQVVIPAGALVDDSGSVASGTVSVYLTPIDPGVDAELDAAPGDFEARTLAGGTVQIESFGMVDLTILDAAGQELNVASGSSLTLSIPAPAGASDLPAELPSWSFDETAGVWRQEGTLTLDGGGAHYVGEIPHLSFWNADHEIDTTCVIGTAVDAASGDPIGGAQVLARGVDYFGLESSNSGTDGRFVVLAKTSSAVRITVSHAAGGGAQRDVSTGDTVVSRPVTPDSAGCIDVGEVPVARGSFQLSDGRVVGCDPGELAAFRACSDVLVTIAECHSPSGACTNSGGLFSLGYEYENGARLETAFDQSGAVTSTFFGPGGVACGTQVVQGREIVATDASGRSERVGVTVGSGGDVTYACPGGRTYSLSAAEQDRLAACSGGNADESCAEGDPGNVGTLCMDDSECTGPTECCFGVCATEAICALGPDICDSDSDCESGTICCSGTSQCSPISECYGACESDADCAADDFPGPCCDGACVFTQACAGECDSAADCNADYPFCCPPWDAASGGTFCTADIQSCYAYRGCSADADCGAESGLSCCPGQDGADDVCLAPTDCWGGRACSSESDCGGGLTCCDRSDIGADSVCESELDCGAFRPCADDSECAEGLVCCAAFGNLCSRPEFCL